MNLDLKKTLLLTLGVISIFVLGALGMLVALKMMAPVTTVAPATTPVAQVINVKPHYVTKLVAYRKCHAVAQTVMSEQKNTSGVGTLIGGIAGGAAASTIGQASGKTAATIGGALLGAIAGNAVESSMNQPQAQTVYSPECTIQNIKKSVQNGYEVTYSYNGQQKMVVMQKAPAVGDAIPVTLAAVPVDQH